MSKDNEGKTRNRAKKSRKSIIFCPTTCAVSEGSFIEGEKSVPLDVTSGRRQHQLGRLKVDWHLLFWMFSAFATLYFSNFASNILFNPHINRYMYKSFNSDSTAHANYTLL